MKRSHIAILTSQTLVFALIITFIFADHIFDLTGTLQELGIGSYGQTTYIAACLIGLAGSTSVWLAWYYMTKADTVRDMLVVCAWTHQIKSNGRWLSLEEFLREQHGYSISHGLSEAKLVEMQDEIDSKWRWIRKDQSEIERSLQQQKEQRPAIAENIPLGLRPIDAEASSERPAATQPTRPSKGSPAYSS